MTEEEKKLLAALLDNEHYLCANSCHYHDMEYKHDQNCDVCRLPKMVDNLRSELLGEEK